MIPHIDHPLPVAVIGEFSADDVISIDMRIR